MSLSCWKRFRSVDGTVSLGSTRIQPATQRALIRSSPDVQHSQSGGLWAISRYRCRGRLDTKWSNNEGKKDLSARLNDAFYDAVELGAALRSCR